MAANIPNIQDYIAAGIDPKTKLPQRLLESGKKDAVLKALRIKDEQQFVNRFVWYNLPDGLTGQLLERILYYRGQGCFFYCESLDKFFFLPYALEGNIDIYGRYLDIRPLTFRGPNQDKNPDGKLKFFIDYLHLIPQYDLVLDAKEKEMLNSAVILKDYTEQYSERIIPRKDLNDPILSMEAEMIPFMRTSLENETGAIGLKVSNEDETVNVEAMNNVIKHKALEGGRFTAVVGAVEMQELGTQASGKSPDFMQGMESIDDFRLSLMGISSSGLFQKKAHMLEDEMSFTTQSTKLVYADALKQRQRFCDIVNSIWDLGIFCSPSETLAGDTNADGFVMDEMDQSGTMEGDQPNV